MALFEELGFRQAFGIPGGAISALFNSLSRSQSIRTILMQHESGGAYAALGVSMTSRGKEMGLCYATTGPGITNLITGVAAAYEERMPLFVVTGNVALRLRGKGAAQDAFDTGVDAVRMLEPVTAKSVCVRDSRALLSTARELYELARRTRLPVHMNIPVDVSSAELDEAEEPSGLRAGTASDMGSEDPSRAIDAAVAAFLAAERPLLFIGHGVKLSGLANQVLGAARAQQLPILVTSHAKGTFPEDDPQFRGTFGFAASESGEKFLKSYRPDAIAVLGSRMGELSTLGWSDLLKAPSVRIHVDRDPLQLGRVWDATHLVHADIEAFVGKLKNASRAIRSSEPAPWAEREATDRATAYPKVGPVHPAALMELMEFVLPSNAMVFSDIGNSMAWAIRHLSVHQGQEFFLPFGLASMGSGLCGSIGAKLAHPERPVVCFTGDCTMLMHGTEIFSAAQSGIGVKVIVLNDGGHGMVDHGHRILGLTDVRVRFGRHVDFSAFAQLFGVRGFTAWSFEELSHMPLADILRSPEPCVIDVRIDASAVPPILARARVLGQADRRPS